MTTKFSRDDLVFVEKSLAVSENSRQVEDQTIRGIVHPPITFNALQKAYGDSFILGGIFEKLASAANSKFKPTKSAELDALLETLDLKYLFENILVFGNAFIEKVRNGRGNVIELLPFLTVTVNAWLMDNRFAYLQRVSGKEAFFLPEEIIHAKTTSMTSLCS